MEYPIPVLNYTLDTSCFASTVNTTSKSNHCYAILCDKVIYHIKTWRDITAHVSKRSHNLSVLGVGVRLVWSGNWQCHRLPSNFGSGAGWKQESRANMYDVTLYNVSPITDLVILHNHYRLENGGCSQMTSFSYYHFLFMIIPLSVLLSS